MSDSDDAALGENVAFFPGPTAQPYAPDLLLRGALNAKLSEVIILGWDDEGELFFRRHQLQSLRSFGSWNRRA